MKWIKLQSNLLVSMRRHTCGVRGKHFALGDVGMKIRFYLRHEVCVLLPTFRLRHEIEISQYNVCDNIM